MKRSVFLLFLLLVIPVSISFSTPPTSITLSYDASKGILHVEAIHPSFNLEKSYVRLMNVYVNGNQVSTMNYSRQDDPNKFTDDVPVSAQEGDVIKVDLFCSLGGELAQELTVTKPEASKPNQSTDTGPVNGE
jgi:hypothetical protein